MRLPITYKINLSTVGNIKYQLHIHYDYNEETDQYSTNVSFIKSKNTQDIELFTYPMENIRTIFADMGNDYYETHLPSFYRLEKDEPANQSAVFIKDNDDVIIKITTVNEDNTKIMNQEEIKMNKDMILLLISYFNFHDINDDDVEVFDELESLGFIF